MSKHSLIDAEAILKRAQPLTHQQAHEIQPFGHLVRMPIALSANACKESVEHLNQLLADTMTLRDLYKKHHWQVAGPTFYQLHLLFDKHYEQQSALVDAIAERIQMLGGVSLAMAPDVAETTLIPRPPKGREEAPVQISRLLHAHEIVLKEARTMAKLASERGDDGTNDLDRERHHPVERTAGVVRRRARRGRAGGDSGVVNILIFGATGMVGQGVLREALLDSGVTGVVTVGRRAAGVQDPKLRELVQADLFHLEPLEAELAGFDGCFYCLGVTSVGMSEADYTRITYDLTVAVAQRLARLNPQMTFIFVSGAGADSSEQGRLMWARVKGRAENGVARLPFKAAYTFRPGVIQPLHGITSRTGWYRALYVVMGPVLTAMRWIAPSFVLTTDQIGRAMLEVVRHGAQRRVLEAADISRVARGLPLNP